ncbi:M23 family metallopeptidase [Leptospira weilii]|uniref:M23 family metallopeptidase n=1 Tax=Leptospira weilii TaxID=28184 RepID=UPI001FD590F0|nr:M23 family metallopeptidase [Leptospira weilii]
MNKPKEQWYQSQEFQMVTTVVAVAAAPFTGGASLMVAMAVGAGIGAATGAASGGLKGALVGAVGGAAGAAVKSFTGGAVNVGLSYSAENGFGASVGVGYGPATVSVGISERGGTSVDVGFNKAGFNAGLSYNSKTGSVSGSAGFTSQSSGTGFALSYSEGDGFGASLSKSFDSGLNGGLSWSEKGGVGGNIGYEAPGDKDKPKNSLANQMKGAGGTLSFSQRDGLSAALNASGGVNAGNWSQSGGFQANTNFLADKWKADFVSKQGELEELQSKGLSKEQATAILDAQAHAESKAAQEKNNQESGKSVLDGAGYAATRKEGEDGSHGVIGFGDDGPTPAHGAPSSHDPGQTLASSGSFDPDGKPTGSQRPGVQADGSINVVGSRTPTLGERAASLFGSIADGAKGLWNRATGGNQPNIDPHQIVRIGENGLAEYANGARTSIAFNEKTDGPFSQPRTNTIHGAVDLMTPIGTKVSALEDGVVTIARNKPDDYLRYPVEPGKNTKLGGASISIRHTNANGETVFSYYAHNSKVLVRDGEKVFKGQVIALSGQSGNTPGGPHIHQEVNKYVDGKRVQIDPLKFSWEKFNANKNEN